MQQYDENRLGWGLDVDYRYWQGLSLAVGYVNFGKIDVDFSVQGNNPEVVKEAIKEAYPVSGSGWTLVHAYTHAITPQIRARLELGLTSWDGDIDVSDGRFDSDVDAETDVFFGVGLDYEVVRHWHAGVQVRRYNLERQALMSWGLRSSYSF